ncbi:hypothetical protein JRQ81_009019 [Phrynocephalus forsythii]|uniref:Ig-like domain-containing protein n=1 Tax=Phrynocephalus forsythii TaxID=171643 RepID=A0A9Q1ASH9_9SAUR|nr:hypothetical protein JRQ81_009019 [Phrynocephalus forsythii]
MECPGGKVQWRGLDTDLGDVVSSGTCSALMVTNATVRAEGEKSCVGQCQGKPSQKKVELRVYSFPDTLRLASQPERLTEGQPARLSCALSHVYPPGALTLGWFRGDERLEAPVEEEEMEMDQLFAYHSVLEVPRAVASAAYKCQAILEVGHRAFRQEKVVTVGLPDATEKDPLAFGRMSPAATPKPPAPAGWISSSTAPDSDGLFRFPGVTSGAATTVVPALDLTTETGNSNVETSRPSGFTPPEMETKPLTPEVSSNGNLTATFLRTTSRPSASTSQRSTLGAAPTPKAGACRPAIKSEPSQGATGRPLRVTCHVPLCGGQAELRWVEVPAPPSQYRLEDAEYRSTLTVDSAGREHQGVYQCVLISSPPRTASLWVAVSYDEVSAGSIIAASTAGSLFGLAVTGYVAYRMWRTRCKHVG